MKGLESPYKPVDYEPSHAFAVQALTRGECPPHLQQEFLRWLIEDVCATYDQSYRVEPCNTAFAEGRRFCGNTVVKMQKIDATKLASLMKSNERGKNDETL